MIKMVVEKGTAKNKKLKAIFYDGDGKKIKTSQFGDNRYEDYTLSKDKKQREKYRNEVQLNPYKVRAYTKYEKERMKKKKELTCQ